MTEQTQSAPRHMGIFIAGAGVLVVAGLGLFWAASRNAAPADPGAVEVTIRDGRCAPRTLEVPAGQASFLIRNGSDRPLEWEILDGVMVLAERENIAPGFSATLTTRLKPGSYDITCGLLSNPRGTLTVLPTAESEAARAKPPLRDFIGPLSERRVQMMRAAGRFERAAQDLDAALQAGDRVAAQAAWSAASAAWAGLGPVTLRASDLMNRIAVRPDVLAGGEADPAFTGLYRIEYGLWHDGSAEGLAPVGAALVTDAAEMRARVAALDPAPEDIAGDAARYARHLAEGQIAAGLDRYAGDDRAVLTAALDGVARSGALLDPLTKPADPAAQAAFEAAVAQTRAVLAAETYAPAAVASGFGALAEALTTLNSKLGLED